MSRASFTLIAVACFLGDAGNTYSDAPKKELAELQGEWQIAQVVSRGEATPDDVLKMMRAVIAGNKASFFLKDKAVNEFTIEGIDATKSPKTIEIEIEIKSEKEKRLGIYKLDKGVLTLCAAKERPTAFESKEGSLATLMVLTRQSEKWVLHTSKETKISITMPGTPEETKKPGLLQVSLLLPNNRKYALVHTANPEKNVKVDALFDEIEKGYAKQKFFKVLDVRKIALGKHPGREFLFKIDNPMQQTYLRNKLFLVGDQIHQVMVLDAGIEELYNTDAKRYFDSFKLLQEDKEEEAGKLSGPLLLKVYTICDVPRNDSQPLSTILAPADWRAESDVKWIAKEQKTIPINVRARFTSPDGTAAVEFFAVPQGNSSTSPNGALGDPPPQDVIAALSQLAKSSRPKARLKLLDKKASRVENTGQAGNTAQWGLIRFAYEENGQTFEEAFAGTLYIQITPLGDGYEGRRWFMGQPHSIKAVQGKLNDLLPLGQAMVRSARMTPEFSKALEVANQVMTNMRKLNRDLSKFEFELYREANRQVNDQWRQVCDERWFAEQKIAEGRRDILGGVHRFEGKDREVIAPITYKHLWDNGQGYFLLTNDPSFRPGPEFKGTWTQLKPKR